MRPYVFPASSICAMVLAMYACAAHAERMAPIRDLAPIIESSVTQIYQPPLDAPATQAAANSQRSAQSQPSNGNYAGLDSREANACLKRKQQIDQQQQKLSSFAGDLQRDKHLVNRLAERVESEKPKRQSHSVQAMNNYQALLRQYEQQVQSLNDRTHLYNQLAEDNRISVRQYNSLCSGRAYRSSQLSADAPAVQPIRRQPAEPAPENYQHGPSAYPAPTPSNPQQPLPGIPSVGGF